MDVRTYIDGRVGRAWTGQAAGVGECWGQVRAHVLRLQGGGVDGGSAGVCRGWRAHARSGVCVCVGLVSGSTRQGRTG